MQFNTPKGFSLTSENIAYFLLALFVFIIPLSFSPSQFVNFIFAKTIPLFVITIAALFFFIFQVFREGKLKFSLHPSFLLLIIIPIWYVIAGLFAENVRGAFLGTGIEIDTVSQVAILFLFAILVSYFLRSKDKIFMIYLAFGVSFTLLSVFHILRLFFGPQFLSFGIFVNLMNNTIGKWNEVAIISGIAIILSLMGIEFLKLSRGFRIFSYIILVLSTFLAIVTNFEIFSERSFQFSFFSFIGLFALISFVYFLTVSYEKGRKEGEEGEIKRRKIPITSLILLVISVFLSFAYSDVRNYVESHFQVTSYEERPTWNWTAKLALATLKQKPFTGYGPNNFVIGWAINKPDAVNNSPVWSRDFQYGVGYIPTAFVTTGPLGFLLWLAFLAFLFWLGIKSLFKKYKDSFSQYLTVSSFSISAFLWIIAFFYIPTTLTLILTLLFTGLFLGGVFREGIVEEKEFAFEASRSKTFVSILVLVVLLVASIFWVYDAGQTFASTVSALKGSKQFNEASNEDNLIKAQAFYTDAYNTWPFDGYLQSLTNISLARAQLNINQINSTSDPQNQQKFIENFVNSYKFAYTSSNLAISINKNNYQNYLNKGGVSESLVRLASLLGSNVNSIAGLSIADTYTDAKDNYEKANKLNPKSPYIYLVLARLEYNYKNFDAAKNYINESLKLKPDYPDPYVLLAQIQVSQNDIEGALNTLTAASLVAPNANLLFNLGLLQYQNKNYQGAASTLEAALLFDPYYSNARYLLAVTYINLDKNKEALDQLKQVLSLNPGNSYVESLIKALQSGQNVISPNPTLNATSTISNSSTSNSTIR